MLYVETKCEAAPRTVHEIRKPKCRPREFRLQDKVMLNDLGIRTLGDFLRDRQGTVVNYAGGQEDAFIVHFGGTAEQPIERNQYLRCRCTADMLVHVSGT